jgi:hypothetical protein
LEKVEAFDLVVMHSFKAGAWIMLMFGWIIYCFNSGTLEMLENL